MYTVSIEKIFSAAHCLREYKGKCEALPGHNWKVEVVAGADQLDPLGMVVDFTVLKKITDEILDRFDHVMLNDVPPFDTINPSSENLARVVFDEVASRLDDERVRLLAVSVWESDTSKATYTP